MNNHMEQAAKAAKKPPTNEKATAGLSSASDIGPYPNFGVAVQFWFKIKIGLNKVVLDDRIHT